MSGTQALDEALENAGIERTPKVVITLGGRDQEFEQEMLGVNIDSSQSEVLEAVSGILSEMGEGSLTDEEGEFTFVVRKATEGSQNIYVYPKPAAG